MSGDDSKLQGCASFAEAGERLQTSGSRRSFLQVGALSLLGWAAGHRTALSGISVRTDRKDSSLLVVLFLRGGADGLSLVAPYAEEQYRRVRPTIGLASPDDRTSKDPNRLIDLNGFFGLHPSLRPLADLYHGGELAVIHACGSGDQTRSHFEAMSTMERGMERETGAASGWIARHLDTAPWENDSPLRAVAVGAMVPASLEGTSRAIALQSLADLKLPVPFGGAEPAIRRSLESLYGGGSDLLYRAGQEALQVLRRLDRLAPETDRSTAAAGYPKDDLGEGLRQVAVLARSGVGLEVACLDHGSYDTHVAQIGLLPSRLASLGASLAAFAADVGSERWRKTTVVVMSEFGRRVEENSGAGTDHGRGGAMMVLGGGIRGGKVYARWPGLAPDRLEGTGDLRVTTDYRVVLAEVLARRLGNPHGSEIFPGLPEGRIGLTT